MCCARFSSRTKSTPGGSPSSPYSAKRSASRTRRAALASTRVGTQPSFVHTPPMFPRSTSATSAPSSLARSAAITPAGPPPITTTSNIFRLAFAEPQVHRPILRRPQPQRDVRRLHRLPHDRDHLITQPVEVGLVPQPDREGRPSRCYPYSDHTRRGVRSVARDRGR